jgi:hypothetical protein
MHAADAINMATSGTFYLDAPSLSTATVVYSNATLTTVAADGYYSDGSISREQVSGTLLPPVICPACAIPCGGTISASGNQGIYYLNTDLGTGLGAVVISFDPLSVPDGILAVYDSTIYNGVSSPSYGWLQGTAGLPTYIGATGSDCGIVANSPFTLDEFEYNGTTFAALGTTTSVSVLSGQMELTASAPGNTVMVIPKTAASPSVLNLSFIGPCSGTAFSINVSCPAALPSFASSTVNVDSSTACADTVDQTYYVAYVTGGTGVLGLYDLVFSDANGEFKLGAGYYKTTAAGTNEWFQVDANGVIIAFGDCVEPPVEINVQSVGGYMEPCTGGGIDDYMGAVVSLDSVVDVDTTFVVEVYYVETGGTCGGTEFFETLNVVVPNGSDISNFNACTEGVNFPAGAVICSACIVSSDNPNVVIGAFQCPS